MKLNSLFIFTLVFVFISSISFAQKISPLEKGDKAPFNGILYSPEADQKRELKLLDTELKLKKIKLYYDEKLKKLEISHDAKNAILKGEIDVNEKREQERIKIKNEQIEFLEKQSNSGSNLWWYFGGIATGIVISALTIAFSIWGLSNINETNN